MSDLAKQYVLVGLFTEKKKEVGKRLNKKKESESLLLLANPWASSAWTRVVQFTSGKESVLVPMTERFPSYPAKMFGGIFIDMNETAHECVQDPKCLVLFKFLILQR